jgi:vitamin B12 transporter
MARVVMLLLMLVLTAVPAVAQEPKKLDPVIVTGTKIETPAEQVGATVTVIDGEEIEQRVYQTVDEALRQVPGVEIRRSGSFGKTTSISIRGANPNQVQVLVDGVRVKSSTTGQAELSDIAPESIDRIEIIRGPQSTIYGADAIGGVVQIFTKKGSGPPTAYASQEIGNYDTYRAKTGISGSWKAFDYSLGFMHLESNGQTINDGMNQNAVAGRFGLDLPWGNTRISGGVRYNKTDTGVPVEFVGNPAPIVPTIDPNTHQESETYTANADLRTRPVDWWEGEVRYGRYWNKQHFIDPPDPFTCPPATFGFCNFPGTFQTTRNEVEALSHFHLAKWSTSTFGIEWREEEANVQGTSGFGPFSRTWSGLFQQQFRFFDRLFMAAGVRVEDNNNFGRTTTERGSLAYVVKEWGSRLHGSAGSGFRAPTFNDLFFPGFSNPNLTPETSFSWDVGWDQKLFGDRVFIGFTYFDTKFTNLIACCVPLAVPPFATTANIGRAKTKGVEVTSRVVILDNLVANFNYTYTDTENLDTGRPLPREPTNRYNGSLTWEPVKRLSLFSEIQVASKQFEPLGDLYNSGHTTVNLGGTWRILERWGHLKALDFTTRIQNVFNEQYQEVRGFPALGINALVGLRATLQ